MAKLLSKIVTPDNTPYILKDSTLTAGTCINISAHDETTGARTITNTGVRAVSTGSTNGTISVNTNGASAEVAVKGLGSAAYTDSTDYATANHKHDYLPLGGGTLSGNVNRYYSAASTDPMFQLVSNNRDVVFFDVGHGTSAAVTPSSNYQLKYIGTGSDPNNLLVLTGKNGNTVTEILKTNQTGTSASFIGNSATATNFQEDTDVTLTGVVTGKATSKRGWSIATTIPDGQITNAMLEGKIANGKLSNSKVTIAGKAVSLGGSLSAADLTTALGLSAAMKYKGSLTTLPTATSEDTYGAYNAGDVVTTSSDGKEYVYNKGSNAASSSWVELGDESSYKKKQNTVGDPNSSGTSTSFIKTIEQNANGEITATKAGLPTASASVKGIMQVGTGLSVSGGTVSVSYGTAAGTACQGNDSRLTNARTPTSHTHGNITNGGAITSDEKIAEGDKLVIVNASDSSKLTGSTITFAANGSKFLRDDGTWQSVITAHRTYTQFTGKPTANATPSFGGTFTIQQIAQSTTGQVSGTDRTVKIPALPVASTSTAGIIKIGTTKDDAAAGNHNHDSAYVNISGDTMTGALSVPTITLTDTTATEHIHFTREAASTSAFAHNYVIFPSAANSSIAFGWGCATNTSSLIIQKDKVFPGLTGIDLGTSAYKWNNVYANKFYGDLDGNAATATKATQDSAGNTISTTYLTKAAGVTNVAWDATNKKLTKTINGTTTDVATGAQIKAGLGLAKGDVGLGNVTNDAQIPKSIGTAKGDIIYWSDANEPARLAAGSNGQVLKINSSGLPVWTSDTDTHYTTHMYVNATSGGATSNAATANTTTYLHLYDNTTKRHTIQFKGAGGTSVAADANGVITITGATNTDTKVTQSVLANTTNKKYGILASYYETSAATTTAQTVNRDSKVYLNPFTSSIAAKEYIWHDNAATPIEKAYTIWNAADSSIDFIFI